MQPMNDDTIGVIQTWTPGSRTVTPCYEINPVDKTPGTTRYEGQLKFIFAQDQDPDSIVSVKQTSNASGGMLSEQHVTYGAKKESLCPLDDTCEGCCICQYKLEVEVGGEPVKHMSFQETACGVDLVVQLRDGCVVRYVNARLHKVETAFGDVQA